ncbi:unnamed protein product [Adineta ricciae]|uniref:Uncharacterized protein n=1 Tax=Adineta ricciae TaxID=249248 RepID=A0A813XYX9_ADIRI|nr:unnamed protein product [Adineta ricciae]CAF1311200.1 unnamed protein product [Adineta ricciae]
MSTTITINNNQNMNVPISITLPLSSFLPAPSIVIEVTLLEPEIILLDQQEFENMDTLNHTEQPDIILLDQQEFEDMDILNHTEQPDIIFLGEQKADSMDVFNDFDERIFDFQQDVNMYSNLNTPISIRDTVNIHHHQPTICDHPHQVFSHFMDKSCNSIDEIVDYLQGDINLC